MDFKEMNAGSTSKLDDFLSFKVMLTPMLIRILFIVGIVLVFGLAIFTIIKVDSAFGTLIALLELIFGVVWVRITLEVFIVFFRINETLTQIHNHMKTRDAGGGGGESSGA